MKASSQALGHDHMRQRRQHGHIGAGPQGQVMGRLDMRRFHQIDAARIDHDQLARPGAAASSAG
jgi:hypothetical protein